MTLYAGGALVARAFKTEGIETIFTLCGGHVAPIYDGCLDEAIRIVDMRHEQAAAHAADAYARLTRGAGVAVVTAGPGVTDTVTAVANAYQAASPLVVIGGAAPLALSGRGSLQEMEQVDLMKPITKLSLSIHDTGRIPELMATAFRVALSGRPGPVFLEIPVDVLYNQVDDSLVTWAGGYRTQARTLGDAAYVRRAAELLVASSRPVLLAGSQVYWDGAGQALRRLVEATHLPLYMNGAGRGALPFDHPCVLQLSRGPALGQADLVVSVGTALDFRLNYGQSLNAKAKLVYVDQDAAEIGRNRAVDVGIVGNAAAILEQVLDDVLALGGADSSEWLGALREKETERRARQGVLEHSESVPINHFRFAREIADFVDDDTIIVGDGGDIVAACSKVITVCEPGHWLDPGPLGCLGVGMPFAIAAKLLYPDKKVLVISGDGSFGLNGFEFDTAVRFDLPIVTIVGNDAGWGQIRNPQIALYGEERAAATALLPTRYDEVVRALGGYGECVERPEDIRPALERAFLCGKPACINVMLDPKGLASMQEGKPYVF